MFLRTIINRLLLLVGLLLLIIFGIRQTVNRAITCAPECVGENLRGRNLRGLDLRKVNLVEAQLKNVNLNNADLRDADLSGANLTGATLSGANLKNAKLIGANLTGADLINATLTGADLSGADLTEADLTTNDLRETIVSGARFRKAVMAKVLLQQANLGGLDLSQANLVGADLTGANLSGSQLSGADLSGAALEATDITGAWLNTANLVGAVLKQADLSGSTMIAANLASANLQDAKLKGTILIGANLDGANLRNADLRQITIYAVELDPYHLTNDPVLLELNEMQRTALVTDANLKGVDFDANTLWPASLQAIYGQGDSQLVSEEATSSGATDSDEAQRIAVLFYIKTLENIDIEQGTYKTDLYLDLHWRDPTLEGQDVSALDPATLWDPGLMLVNSPNAQVVFKSYLSSSQPGYQTQLSHRIQGKFVTTYDLHQFPFDRQTLRLNMELEKANSDTAILDYIDLNQEVTLSQKTPYRQRVPAGRYIAGDALPAGWEVEELHIVEQLRSRIQDSSAWSQFGIEVTLRRQSLGYVWKLFMPLLVIFMLVWCVLLVVDSKDLTFHLWLLFLLFVALAVFHAVVWHAVPHPSYLTLFDRYMLTGYFSILAVIFLVCINAMLHRYQYVQVAHWFKRVLEVGYPIVGLVVNLLLYWQATNNL